MSKSHRRVRKAARAADETSIVSLKQYRRARARCEFDEQTKFFYVDLAERLKQIRRLLCISEQQAADAWCVALKTYQKMERGERTRCRTRGLLNFGKTFGVEGACWLISGLEHYRPSQRRPRLVAG